MFGGQEAIEKEKRGAKQSLSSKAGAERRQRQLMTLRHKTHGEILKHLRADTDCSDEVSPAQVNMANQISSALATGTNPNELVWALTADTKPELVPLELLPHFTELVKHGQTPEEVFHGAIMIRKLISVEKNPPYDAIMNTGVVPHLVELLDRNEFPKLQFEAAWALTNIAADTSDKTIFILRCNAAPKFVALLSSPDSNCRDQAAWAIGNIAGEGAACRDELLNHGVLSSLLPLLLDTSQPNNVLQNSTWAVSNLCRSKPLPALEHMAVVLPALVSLLHNSNEHVVLDAAWSISYISDGPQDRIQLALDSGALPRIVELLRAPSNSLKTPAIRTIGNIAVGTDSQTQAIIDSGALIPMAELLSNPKRALRKEASWAFSNIAAGTSYQIEALIRANIFVPLLDCMVAPELDVRKEAVWCVSNVTCCGMVEHLKYLVQIGVIPPLCDTLRVYDGKIVFVVLEALQGFLQMAEDARTAGQAEENIVVSQILECGGVDNLEALQKHPDRNVYELTFAILQSFFYVLDDAKEGDVELTNMNFEQPLQTNNVPFQF